MLADSVEATVRSMSQSGKLEEALQTNDGGEDPLAELVEGIIDERVREGQLDECDLTFRDLRVIERAFADMLRGVYHPRVAYPELGTAKEATA
jgi:membrane-associated HD superfamily phosphohydrolase